MKQENFLSLVFDADQLAVIRAIQKKYKIEKVSKLLRLIAENAAKAKVKKPVARAKQITFRVEQKTFTAVKKIAHNSGNNFSQLFRILISQADKLLSEKALKNLAEKPQKSVPAKAKKSVPAVSKKNKKNSRNSVIKKSVPAKAKKTVPAKAKKSVPAKKKR